MPRRIVQSTLFRRPIIGERINIFPDEPKKYIVKGYERINKTEMFLITSEELEPYEVEEGVQYIESSAPLEHQ